MEYSSKTTTKTITGWGYSLVQQLPSKQVKALGSIPNALTPQQQSNKVGAGFLFGTGVWSLQGWQSGGVGGYEVGRSRNKQCL